MSERRRALHRCAHGCQSGLLLCLLCRLLGCSTDNGACRLGLGLHMAGGPALAGRYRRVPAGLALDMGLLGLRGGIRGAGRLALRFLLCGCLLRDLRAALL